MIGCPHCEKNKSAWKQAKGKVKNMGLKVKEIESKNAPMGMGFPTTRLEDDNGNPIGKEVVGPRKTGGEIIRELGLTKKRTRKTRKQIRRSRHRTLRNNVAFV